MKNFLFILFLVSSFAFSQKELTHEVYFETDKYKVLDTEQNRLLLYLIKLQEVDIDKIEIYGFCDDRGSDSYNLDLSQQRADAIKSMLSDNEIDEAIISNVDGKGEILLKVINSEDADILRGLNRKVEIIATLRTKEEIEIKKVTSKKTPKEPSTITKLKGDLNVGDKIHFKDVLFKTNYSFVLPESKKVLKKIAEVLKKRKGIYFTIQGHVCCTQNSRDAMDKQTRKRNLSVARAKYIYDYLAKQGIDKRRMKFKGMRRLFPLGGDPKFDRRVEILITYVADNNE